MVSFPILFFTLVTGYAQLRVETFTLPLLGHFAPWEWLTEVFAWGGLAGIIRPHDRAPARRARHGRRGGPLQRRSRRRCRCGRPGRHPSLVPGHAPPARLLPARPGLPFPGFDPLAGALRRVGYPHRVRVRRGPARPRIRALQRDPGPRGPRDRAALPPHRLARRALRGRRLLLGRLAGQRDRPGQRPQGHHLHDLADRRRHPDRHGRRLAPLRRDPQPVHAPQRGRHEVPGTGRPHAH